MNTVSVAVRRLLLCVLWCLSAVTAFAQPAADECWLLVSAVYQDGTPFPTAPGVTLYRISGATRTYTGRIVTSEANRTYVMLLSPGPHEIRAVFPTYGLQDGPQTIELFPGPNVMTWRVPPMIPVQGALTPPAGVATPQSVQALLMPVNKGRPQPATCTLANGDYRLAGAFPGPYRLLILSDSGYGLVSFTVPADAKDPIIAPVTLTPGSALTFQVTQQAEKQTSSPLLGVTLTVTGQVERGFVPSLSLRTDAKGVAASLPLPPGTWTWSAYYPGLQQATGKITLAAGDPAQTVTVTLEPPKK